MNEESKWKRKVDALDTAIQLYALKGSLTNDKNVVVPGGALKDTYCTVRGKYEKLRYYSGT